MEKTPKNIVIIGPAYPLRGGLATFNERMAQQFQKEGDHVKIYTFSLQYPGLLFPGKTQYTSGPAPAGLQIKAAISSINFVTWHKVGREIKKLQPDIVIIRYWLPFMAPALGTIARIIRRNKFTKIIGLVDNLVPHEKRPGDKMLTRFFVKPFHAFITMSRRVYNDTLAVTQVPVILQEHPIIDNFGNAVSKAEARSKLQINLNGNYILFFGFIRKYKGLDLLLYALKILKDKSSAILPRLIVAGEFYEDAQKYRQLIADLALENLVILHTDFIANDQVKYYVSAADFIIQPYRDATQSGVTPLAYHFEKPMLVTNVGGLADMVPHGKVGVVTAAEPAAIAAGIEKLYALDEKEMTLHLRAEKQKYSWESFCKAIRQLALKAS